MDPSSQLRDRLLQAARAARRLAYCPYSHLAVGAALACEGGSIVTAANVENGSYGLTLCAERAVVARALAEGQRGFVALAIVSSAARPVPPCGACRQVLHEFAPGLTLYLQGEEGAARETTLAALLPDPFELGDQPC